MNTVTNNSLTFGAATPLEIKAEELAMWLRAGLDEQFSRQFQRYARTADDKELEALVVLINNQLALGASRKQARVALSRSSGRPSVTILDNSRLFGSGWPVARQTFAF